MLEKKKRFMKNTIKYSIKKSKTINKIKIPFMSWKRKRSMEKDNTFRFKILRNSKILKKFKKFENYKNLILILKITGTYHPIPSTSAADTLFRTRARHDWYRYHDWPARV